MWKDEGTEEYGREMNIVWENYSLEQPTKEKWARLKKEIWKAAEEAAMTMDNSWLSVVVHKVHYAPQVVFNTSWRLLYFRRSVMTCRVFLKLPEVHHIAPRVSFAIGGP